MEGCSRNTARATASPLEKLPVELVCTILAASPDVPTLKTAVLSAPVFRNAFHAAQQSVVTEVVAGRVGSLVLPEATAAFAAARLREAHPRPDAAALRAYAARYLRRRPTAPDAWTPRDALRIDRLHGRVEAAARDFADRASASLPLYHWRRRPTWREVGRVQQSFYRFEVFCSLFREPLGMDPDDSEAEADDFFKFFAPWEIEQLRSIHDFLVPVVAVALDRLRHLDHVWSSVVEIYMLEDHEYAADDPLIQHVLSLGLERILEIAETEPSERRFELLGPHAPPGSIFFFYDAVCVPISEAAFDFVNGQGRDGEAEFRRTPFFRDPDPGPEHAWRWAYGGPNWEKNVSGLDKQQKRTWGFIMWDYWRLEDTNITKRPFFDT